MALNGLIGAGVPAGPVHHMIGHELTALHGIDHGRTLAIVLPAVMQVRREAKCSKLLRNAADRVWDIREGSEEGSASIQPSPRRGAFFESSAVPTRLADYQLGTRRSTRSSPRWKSTR